MLEILVTSFGILHVRNEEFHLNIFNCKYVKFLRLDIAKNSRYCN